MSPAANPIIAREVLQALVAAVEEVGVSRADFLQDLELHEESLRSGPRLTLTQMSAYCERALAATRDPAFGLHWAERLTERAFGPVSHLMTQAGTLRRGLDIMTRFAPLFCDTPSYVLIEDADDDSATLRLRDWEVLSPGVARLVAEFTLGSLFKMVRACFAPGTKPNRVCFRFAPPAERAEYTRIFGVGVRFAQPSNELVFARSVLDHASPYVDAELHATFSGLAETRLSRLQRTTSWAARLREHLAAALPARSSMEAAASSFGISERTLRRHLQREGTSYRDIEHAMLASTAKQLIERGTSLAETAYALGFADAGTFHRAFKTWTGTTPGSYREKT